MKPWLAELIENPERVRDIPVEVIPGLIAQLGGLQTVLAAWMIDSQGNSNGNWEDRLISIDEAAQKTGVTEDWIYRRTGMLPFVVRLGRQVRFSEKGKNRAVVIDFVGFGVTILGHRVRLQQRLYEMGV